MSISAEIEDRNINYEKCDYCFRRDEIAAIANISDGRSSAAVSKMDQLVKFSQRRRTFEILVKALVHKDFNRLDQLLRRVEKSVKLDKDWRYLYFVAASEARILKDDIHARKYGKEALNLYGNGSKSGKMIGRVQMVLQNYEAARTVFENQFVQDSTDAFSIAKLAQIMHQLGDKKKSNEYLDLLEGLEKPYQFGTMDYYRAQALANMDREEEALAYLSTAVKKGKRFYFHKFDNDPDLINLFGHGEYERIVKYWH